MEIYLSILFRWLFMLAIVYTLLLFLVFQFQHHIIFHPVRLPTNYLYHFDFPFEEFSLCTSDKKDMINVIFVKTTTAYRKGIVVYCHGNADNLQRWANYHTDFTKRGYDFLVFDYRGYGKSTGAISEKSMYEDALLCYDWAILRGYKFEEIVIYGRSLGSGIASHLASNENAKMLCLETPYNNIKDIFLSYIPFSPVIFPFKYDYANDIYLPKIKYPIHIFHGTKDLVIPFSSAIRLKPLLKPKDSFTVIEGAGHKDLRDFEQFQQQLDIVFLM